MHPARVVPMDDDPIPLFVRSLRHSWRRRRRLMLRLWRRYLNGRLVRLNRFPPIEQGEVMITQGARLVLFNAEERASTLLEKHRNAQFGEISTEDLLENEDSIRHGGYVFGIYRVFHKQEVVVVTNTRQHRTLVLVEFDLWIR